MYTIDYSIIVNWKPYIIKGCGLTLYISAMALIIGIIIGTICGSIRSSPVNKFIHAILISYIEVFRGTPLLVQLFFIYFGLGQIGIAFSPMQASILTLALNSGAYISEIVRSVILSVDYGQYEAARALGMNYIQTMRYIILPQALRLAVPQLVNCFSSILKDSSLVSVLAIAELTRIGQEIYASTFRPFEAYTTLGVLYLIMTLSVSQLSRFIEVKVKMSSR